MYGLNPLIFVKKNEYPIATAIAIIRTLVNKRNALGSLSKTFIAAKGNNKIVINCDLQILNWKP
ncbi:hypothetical protein NBRC110019_05900 [Neptunitalea chrysea]|uniref:Uncharacterized protein n=1 Tax=Neptunitalea chrysea TaxID=1647581 RepID=A0A9W6B365_9FLAO|nr:hypothetical protein NBRC110019_05900 [Neptunitalea chrysea]